MSKEAKLGLFVVVVAVVFLFFTINMSTLFSSKGQHHIRILFDSIGTLERGAPVKQAGVDVGEVVGYSHMKITEPTPAVSVVVDALVNEDAIISADSKASIQTLGMMGEKYIEITFGSLLEPASERPLITTEGGPEAKPMIIIEGQGPVQLDQVMKNAADLTGEVQVTIQAFNSIIDDSTMQTDIKLLIGNLRQVSDDLNNMMGGGQNGSTLLSMSDIVDWPGFISKLVQDASRLTPNPGKRISNLLPQEIRSLIESSTVDPILSTEDKTDIIHSLNNLLRQPDFYREQDFSNTNLPNKIIPILARNRDDLSTKEVQELNRFLLEAAYPLEITKRQQNRMEAVMTNLEVASAKLSSVMATAELLITESHSLVSENRPAVRKSIDNVSVITQDVRENLMVDIKEISKELKTFSTQLTETSQRANSILAKVDGVMESGRPEMESTLKNLNEMTAKAKQASGRVDEILQKVQSDDGGLVHQLIYDQELAKSTKSTITRASGFFDDASIFADRFSIIAELQYFPDRTRFDSDDNYIRADFGLQFDISDELYIYAGGNNLGSSAGLEAQVGYLWGPFAFHGGMIESEVGMGVDWNVLPQLLIGAEVLGITSKDEERFDAYSEFRVWDKLYLTGGVQDVFDEFYPNLGLKVKF